MTLEELDDSADMVQGVADLDPFQSRGAPCWKHADGNWIVVLTKEEPKRKRSWALPLALLLYFLFAALVIWWRWS